jgi:hypothetical protein
MRGTLKLLSVGLLSVALLAPAAQARPVHIVAYGDSMTAGWLVARKEAYPAQLQAALRKKGHDVVVHNAASTAALSPTRCCISTKRSRRTPTSHSSNSAPTTCAHMHRRKPCARG